MGCGLKRRMVTPFQELTPSVILIRVVEGPDGRGQHFDLVIGQQPFSKHLAVNFCAAVDIFAVTDDDECYFFIMSYNLPNSASHSWPMHSRS